MAGTADTAVDPGATEDPGTGDPVRRPMESLAAWCAERQRPA